MKVELSDGRIINVRWKRIYKKREKKEVVDTICLVSGVNEKKEGSEKYFPIATGLAYQSPDDRYVRAVGRKISLTRAVEEFKIKKDREKIWQAYFENCNC